LSVVCTISEVVQLGRHRLRWKELVECMVWIVLNFIEQFIVSPPAAAQIPADQAGRSRFACFDAETFASVARRSTSWTKLS